MNFQNYVIVGTFALASCLSYSYDELIEDSVSTAESNVVCGSEVGDLETKLNDLEVLLGKNISLELGSTRQFEVANILTSRIKSYGDIVSAIFKLDSCRLKNNFPGYVVGEEGLVIKAMKKDLTQRYTNDKFKLDSIKNNFNNYVFKP